MIHIRIGMFFLLRGGGFFCFKPHYSGFNQFIKYLYPFPPSRWRVLVSGQTSCMLAILIGAEPEQVLQEERKTI